jgi:mRNA interferase RelE/StbE
MLEKLDKYTQKLLLSRINKNLKGCADPRIHGKALSGNRSDQWRYRVGDYRIICLIEDSKLVILVLVVGHRRDIYKRQFSIF